jgi:hypothetical protein
LKGEVTVEIFCLLNWVAVFNHLVISYPRYKSLIGYVVFKNHLPSVGFFFLTFPLSLSFLFLKTGSHYVAQASLELTTPLSHPPKCWD